MEPNSRSYTSAAQELRKRVHHILGNAEAIKRGLPPEFVVTLASAHAAPTNGQEVKVVNWIRAAATLAEVNPVDRGYPDRDSAGGLRLRAARQLGRYSNTLVEYVIHNLSDSDFAFTGPAMSDVDRMLSALAPEFGFKAADAAAYNNNFRNVALSRLSAEHLLIIYGNNGLDGVRREIEKIRTKFVH